MSYKPVNGGIFKYKPQDPETGRVEFRCGTVSGKSRFAILKIVGRAFSIADLMGYLKAFCLENHVHLVFEHVGEMQRAKLEEGDPKRFASHLKKRGFANIGGTTHWWKSLYRMIK